MSDGKGITRSKIRKRGCNVLNLNEIRLPKAGQKPEVYADFLLSLRSDAGVWDRGKGRMSWVQGRALNLARPACKKPGTWDALLKSIKMTASTAKHLRKVADVVTEEQSHVMGYAEMLCIAYPSYRKQLQDDAAADETPKRKNKGNGKVETVETDVIASVVQYLTVAKNTMQKLTDSMPPKIPFNAGIPNVGNVITEANIIRNEADKVLDVLYEWEASLTGFNRNPKITVNGKVAA